jgi:uncharacterized protein (TIGR02118 family)
MEILMAQMIIIYKTPKDPNAFNKHYFEVHVPLAKQLPGLRKYEVSKGPIVSLAGAADTYFIATLHFDSVAAIKEAFASECGRACAADRRILAPDDKDVQMFLLDAHIV